MITTSQFLNLLYNQGIPLGCTVEARIDTDGRVERLFDESGHPAGIVDKLRGYVPTARSVWFGPGLRQGCRGKDIDVAYLPALWCDFDAKCMPDQDKAGALERIRAMQPAPSIVLDTGHGVQGYWLLREYASCAEIVDARQAMRGINAALSEGLPKPLDAVHNPSRVMRLPNTTNRKDPEHPVACRVVECNERRYCLSDFPHVEGYDITGPLPEAVFEPCSAGFGELLSKAHLAGMPGWVQTALRKPDRYYKGDTSRLDWLVVLQLVRYLSLSEAESLWLQSPLGHRPFDNKVQARPDYRHLTLVKALAFASQTKDRV